MSHITPLSLEECQLGFHFLQDNRYFSDPIDIMVAF